MITSDSWWNAANFGQFSVKNKTAVLTGAARGLGLAFADVLAEAGANIAVLDVGSPGDNLDKLRAKHGVKVAFYKTDVTSREQVTAAVEQIEKEFGSVDIKSVLPLFFPSPCGS